MAEQEDESPESHPKELSAALALPGFVPLHDRGQVMVDLAVAITLGATCIRDIRLLEHQRPVFGRHRPANSR